MNRNGLNKLIKEIVENSYYLLVSEGISQVVWHFCPIGSMYSIATNDKFKCSSISVNASDIRFTSLPVNNKTGERKIYPYYMCVSRTPYSGVGYQQMRREKGNGDWTSCLVRIELDGNALNSRFKGMPVNYFNNDKSVNANKITHSGEMLPNKDDPSKMHLNQQNRWINLQSINGSTKLKPKQMKYGKGIPGYEKDKTDKRQMLEYEDRLYSNTEFIDNFSRYIIRIDILCSKQVLSGYGQKSDDILGEIKFVENKYKGKVFIYTSETAFNSRNIRNSINKDNNSKYGSITGQNELLKNAKDYNPNILTKMEARFLGSYAGYITLGYDNHIDIINNMMIQLGINEMPYDIQKTFKDEADKQYTTAMADTSLRYIQSLLYKISKEIDMINGGKTKYKDILNKIQKKDEEYLRSIFKSDVSYLTLKKRFITLKNKQKNVAQ